MYIKETEGWEMWTMWTERKSQLIYELEKTLNQVELRLIRKESVDKLLAEASDLLQELTDVTKQILLHLEDQ